MTPYDKLMEEAVTIKLGISSVYGKLAQQEGSAAWSAYESAVAAAWEAIAAAREAYEAAISRPNCGLDDAS